MSSRNGWKFVVLGSFALVCLGGQAASAQDANMEKAMTAAFGSKEIKKLKIKGHEFNVKPVKSENSGGTVKVKGQISHHRTWQDDDQVYYSFTMRADGTVESFDVNIEKSLMHRALVFAWEQLKDLLKEKLKDGGGIGNTGSTQQGLSLSNELQALEQAIELAEKKIGTGGWEKSAAAIVANVMIRAKTSTSGRVYDRVNYLRSAVKRAPSRRPAGGVTRVIDGTFNVNSSTLNNSGGRPQVRDHRNR